MEMFLKEKEEAADEVDSFLLDLSLKEKRGRGEEGIGEADEGHSEKIPESRWLSSPPSLERSQIGQKATYFCVHTCVIIMCLCGLSCHILSYCVILCVQDCVFSCTPTPPPFICFQALLTFLNLRQKYLMAPLELKVDVSLSQFDFKCSL